jgi:hypothetical protein
MIHGRDLHQAAINWGMAISCTLIVICAVLVVHLVRRIPWMVPL